MKRPVRLIAAALAVCMLIVVGTPPARAYTPPVSTIKVGLYYGSGALPSANLSNVSGYGEGYEFGYYNSQREFVSLAATGTTAISILKDRNMYYAGREYLEGTEGSVVVGCYHIQLAQGFATAYDARAVSGNYSSSFVKYYNGTFYVSIGNYTSAESAYAAAATMTLPDYTINAGTSQTVTVVATGTNRIIFEFDSGTSAYLGVRPISTNGALTRTWFRNDQYYGGFQYARLGGGDLTVVNYVGIEEYTKCVVPRESPSTWPLEALKVQALCSRTYAMSKLNKHSSNGFDLCAGEECQVYGGLAWGNATTNQAVDETAGLYITYNGKLCETYFSSSDGGATENSENVWTEAIPYLRGVIDPYEADIAGTVSNYNWTVTYTPAQLAQRMRDKGYNCSTIVSVAVTKFTELGNVYTVTVKDDSGRTFNITKSDRLRSVFALPSIRFTVGGASQPGGSVGGDIYVNGSGIVLDGGTAQAYAIGGDGTTSTLPGGNVYAITGTGETEIITGDGGGTNTGSTGSTDGKVNGVFTFTGTGRGHNVGVSQWGTYSMAKFHNKTFLEIINFYYTGVTIG